MSFTKLNCAYPENEELHKELIAVIDTIAAGIAENCGEDRAVRLSDDHRIAFGGTAEEPEMCLEFEWQTCFGKPALFASLDGNYTWQEWDFGTRKRLVGEIVKFITARIKGE